MKGNQRNPIKNAPGKEKVVFPPRRSLVVSCWWLAACPEAVHHDERVMMSFHCKICKFLQILQRKDVITRSSWCTASRQAASHRQETTSDILGGNTTISIPGAFLIGFLWFFIINVFYLAYEIRVRSFVRLCWVVVELCWKWVETLSFHFRVCFLPDFFDFFL